MTATVEASYSTVQSDGGGDGKTITTGTEVDSGDWLITAVMSSSNADAISAPGTGTWAEITLPDNVITTSGGQIRLFKCSNPADSTAYTHTLTGGRRTLIGALIGGADASNCVDQASSLESAAGTNHAPPSVTPTAANELVLDFVFHRQFSPDTSNWTVPAAGLTWTEQMDVQGADSNNNIRGALGTATAGSSGVAISTSPWTTTDVNEESMVVRIVIKSAAGGGVSGAATTSNRSMVTAAGVKQAAAGGAAAQRTTVVDTGRKQGLAGAATVQHPASASTTRKQATATAAGLARPATATVVVKRGVGAGTASPHAATGAAAAQSVGGGGLAQARPTATATGRRAVVGAAAVVARTATAVASTVPAAGLAGHAHGPESHPPGAVTTATASIAGAGAGQGAGPGAIEHHPVSIAGSIG